MSIRDLVMSEPLFETHTHQNRFQHHPWDRKNFEEFIQYGTADIATSCRRSFDELRGSPEALFDVWRCVKTTGYGQAAALGCKSLFGLEYTRENADEISRRMREYIDSRGPERVYADLYAHANVRWSVCDMCWDAITNIEALAGKEHLPLMRFALRHDALLVPKSAEDIKKAGTALGCKIKTLADLDDALDEYTDRAFALGRLAALKIGLAYQRDLEFTPTTRDRAARAFTALAKGGKPALKPLHDYLLFTSVARAERLGLPVQIHTGYLAGNWQDIRRGNPEGLIPLLQQFKSVKFDLFHAAWPWSEFLGAVGKEFPNVWIDLCWMWAMNPVAGRRTLDEWLSAVPNNKILGFGADTGSPFGLVGYALQARHGIADVLEAKVTRGEYDAETAAFVAKRLLRENAQDVFGKW